MKKILISISYLVIIISYYSCSSNNVEPEEQVNYMSLSVGDIREYFDTGLEIHQIWEIKEKIKRSDGLDVYKGVWSSSSDTSKHISYYAISGNYFISTDLNKTNNTENPYREQRLAKINPKDGDIWLHTLGVADSEKVYFNAKYIGNYKTFAADFKDVFSFTLSNLLIVYYSNFFGHIGSSSPLDTTYTISLKYAKINGKEIGEYVPFDQKKQLNKMKANSHLRKVNFLGQRNK